LPPVDDTTATAAVEVEPAAIDVTVADEAVRAPAVAEVVPSEIAPTVEAAAVETTVADESPAAAETASIDDEAARRAELLRGLFQTARHDAVNPPSTSDSDPDRGA
ncbi:MAG: hypothetical protein RR834_12010, partial [Thermomonas sp.]